MSDTCPLCGDIGIPEEAPPDGKKVCGDENCPVGIWDTNKEFSEQTKQ